MASSTSIQTTPPFDLAVLLESARATLRGSDEYAANPAILHRHRWITHKTVSYLIHNDCPELAFFTILTKFVSTDFSLEPSMLWTGDKNFYNERVLQKAQLSCIGVSPIVNDPDFDAALLNVSYFIARARDNNRYKTVLSLASNSESGIIASYRPFKSLDSFADAVEIKHVIDTRSMRPIAAFDMHGERIQPRDYKHKIEGAVVVLRFSLSRTIETQPEPPTENFHAEIESIRVVVPP